MSNSTLKLIVLDFLLLNSFVLVNHVSWLDIAFYFFFYEYNAVLCALKKNYVSCSNKYSLLNHQQNQALRAKPFTYKTFEYAIVKRSDARSSWADEAIDCELKHESNYILSIDTTRSWNSFTGSEYIWWIHLQEYHK